ncbi:MAG: DUF3160 domain-containing protein [Candidatus Margulisiibacteriota bacterium]
MRYILALLLLAILTFPAIGISNLDEIQKAENMTFTPAQLSALEKNGFFIVPVVTQQPLDPNDYIYPGVDSSFDEMVDAYMRIGGDPDKYHRSAENTPFITSDLLLHVYHVLIDRTFQSIEQLTFSPTLKDMIYETFSRSLKDYKRAPSDAKKSVVAYYLIPLVMLETETGIEEALELHKDQTPPEIYEITETEIKKIMDAKGLGPCALFPEHPNKLVDYTQFKPRSHYTKNEILKNYFRAMMWFGTISFELNDPALTQMALYITKDVVLTNTMGDWERIYYPTGFFVGVSDDLNLYDYAGIMEEVYGKGMDVDAEFPIDEKLDRFRELADRLEGPKILSQPKVFPAMADVPSKEALLASTKGFRFMGQRFVPDSYIFSTLTQGDEPPDEETGQKLPGVPTALMVMSVFGSDTADRLLGEWIKENAPDSDRVIAKYMKKLKDEFSSYDKDHWTQNVYWSWLYTLKALFEPYDSSIYPAFMKGRAWKEKCLLTSLGSWTELRHDTLLYAKQSAAEMGAGWEEIPLPPQPKGYVEPNQEFFARLIDLNRVTINMYTQFDLLGKENAEYLDRYEKFVGILDFLSGFASNALLSRGSSITDDDYERLRNIAHEFNRVVTPVPYEDMIRARDTWTGLIADVHSDYAGGEILYEAVGRPMKIFVLVKDEAGFRITRGLTYSYYEFTEPLGDRMTDESWQGIVYEKKADTPSMPWWTGDIISQ